MNTANQVVVSVKLNAFTPCINSVLIDQGYSYSALLGDINSELGKSQVRDAEVKTGSTRYSKKADETSTSGQVTFKAVNKGTTTPLQFKAFNDAIAKVTKQFPSMELGKDFKFPAQFASWLETKRMAKPAKSPKVNGKANGKAKVEAKSETATAAVSK